MIRRHPHAEPLDPATAADLAALDAALAGATDPEWTALVAALRDEPPAPRPAFSVDLDARAAAGFPRQPRRLPRTGPRRALGVLAVASAFVVGGVVVATGPATDPGARAGAGAVATTPAPSGAAAAGAQPEREAGDAAAPPADAATAASGASAAATPAPVPGAIEPFSAGTAASPGRSVERTTTLELTTAADDLQDAADGIVQATQAVRGVVAASQVERTASGGSATFTLRIPSARLDDALRRLSRLADVARLSQATQDITGTSVSARQRLGDARAERKALLAAFARATEPRPIAVLRARLAANRAEIARRDAAVRVLRRRADTARVDVTLTASGAAAVPAGGRWGPGEAARDALRVLEVVAGVALVAGAVLVPLGLLAAGVALLAGGLRRRRREAALGTA